MGHPDHGGCGRSVRPGHRQISGVAQRSSRSACRRRLDLVRTAELPFIASSAPDAATSGIPQPSSRASGASARAVTTSKRSPPVQLLGAAADHPTLLQTELLDHLVQKDRPPLQRLDQGHASGRVDRWPGPVPAGRPRTPGRRRSAPDGTSEVSARQLSTCRSHSFGRLPGPDQARARRPRWRAARRTAPPAAAAPTRTPSAPPRAWRAFHVKHPSSGGQTIIMRAGPPRTGAAPRPRTPRTGRRRPPRRARPSARTGSSGPAAPAPRSP